jgi:chromosome segregation ATPase
MSGDDEGTITDEVRIRQLTEELSAQTERVTKVFSAFEQAEKEIVQLKAEIDVLEGEVIDKEIEREGIEQLLGEKDHRLRDLELTSAKRSKQVDHLEPELEKMEEKFTREKDRLTRVFEIAEELDNDLRLAVAELKARDDWYVDHMKVFEDLNKAIKRRYEMIEAAVESERKSQHMQRAINEKLEEAMESRSEEAAEKAAADEAAAEVEAGVEVAEEE